MIGERPPVKYIVDLVTKDGKVKNCETHVQIVMGQNGQPWVQGIVRDLTEQLALTNAIGVEKRRFESLVETASSIIVGTDMKGRITLFNHGAEAALGYLKQEALGGNFFELLVPENDHEKLLNLMWKTMQTKETPQGIASMLTKRGDLVKVNWTVNFLMNDQNETEGFLGIGQDMTERVKLEEELKDRNKILEVLSQLGLISSISFDSRKIVSAALEMTMRLFDFQKGTAFIVNSVSGNIEKVATANLENPNLEWNGVSDFPEVFKETVISKG
jgi:PAS domain S-box-containing protein